MNKLTFWIQIACFAFLPAISFCGVQSEQLSMLIVKGEASIYKPADQMEISLSVLTVGADPSHAMLENNEKIHSIIDSLLAIDLDESEYETGRFQIRPVYKSLKDHQQSHVISHYEVVNTLKVQTLKLDLADKILQQAVLAGANQIDHVKFNLFNPQAYREEVITVATQNALSDANALANAAGVQLQRVVHLSLDHWQNMPAPYMMNKAMDGGLEAFCDAIEPGNAEIHATVNVTYEIAPL